MLRFSSLRSPAAVPRADWLVGTQPGRAVDDDRPTVHGAAHLFRCEGGTEVRFRERAVALAATDPPALPRAPHRRNLRSLARFAPLVYGRQAAS